jgi:hypothetical protein
MVESFESHPESVGGSVTITNGVKIEVVAKYIHHLSTFGKDLYELPAQYFFAY